MTRRVVSGNSTVDQIGRAIARADGQTSIVIRLVIGGWYLRHSSR
jgi:hypothetical protein